MLLVTSKVRSERLATCRSCEHCVGATQSCGTLGLGEKVGDVKLCGCIMPVKTTLKIASCPLDKWGMTLSKEDVAAAKRLLAEVNPRAMSANQNAELQRLYNSMTGRKNKTTQCKPCVREMYEKMVELLRDE